MYVSLLSESDHLLREQFETKTLPEAGFKHREHVRLTWIYLTLEPQALVAARLCRSLLELATSHGAARRFHCTLTVAWVRIIDSERRSYPDRSFDDLVAACPWLMKKDLPLMYYSHERLYSEEARHRWVEPDRQPLPAV